MSRILLFDDDDSHRNEICQELSKLIGDQAQIEPFDGKPEPVEGFTYERHIERQLRGDHEVDPIGLIACDKELGLYSSYPGLSANAISVVARNLGVPFCQYSQNPNANRRELARFDELRRWDCEEITLAGNSIREWASDIAKLWNGFESITSRYQDRAINKLKPAAALAAIMGRKDAESRISLYGSGDQSIMTEVFALVDESDPRGIKRMPRILGTWLQLSILRFPGLLVNETAAASYLNIATKDFDKPEIQEYFKDAVYCGPFSELLKWWWRDDLDSILLEGNAEDGKQFVDAQRARVEPCLDEQAGDRAGFYCMITQLPVSRANSKGNINWFPSGADLSRIRSDEFEQITSLVSM